MGFFTRKKKVAKKPSEPLVSASEVVCLLEMAIQAIDDYQIEYEFEFQYQGRVHKIGIGYNRELAPKKGYVPEYMTVYLDDQVFASLQDLWDGAQIDGEKFAEAKDPCTVDDFYKDVLEAGGF